MLDVQIRALQLVEQMATASRELTVALVSHADVIKAIVCYYLGLPIDAWSRFEISPASITTLSLFDCESKIIGLNEVVW